MFIGRTSFERGRTHGISSAERSAFTLIEILVVVAIIALLLAILIPSLSRAREQAKVVTCAANEQQIGRMVTQYTAENRGYVPVVLNYAAHGTNVGSVPNVPVPARAGSMSIALRGYANRPSRTLVDSSSNFYFDKSWNNATLLLYEKTMMPECFACPFGRRGDRTETSTVTSSWILYTVTGHTESYDTWRWQSHYPGRDVIKDKGVPWSGTRAPGDGVVQYGEFSWNRGGWDDGMYNGSNMKPDVINAARRWEISDGRFVPNSSNPVPIGQPSSVAVSWCILGESMDWYSGTKWYRVNLGSHRGSLGGGTNALFADGHVKWIKGTRLGWP